MKRIFSSLRQLGLLIAIFLLFPVMTANAAGRVQQTGHPIVIVIDPGHGGDNNGTTENGFLEKEMTMTTALAMKEALSQFDDVEIYLTHEDDKDLTLKERAQFAKKHNADFLISLHYNASETHLLYGAEVWISLIPEYHVPGYQLGTAILREFRDLGLPLRGIKTRRHSKGMDYYGILREAATLGLPAMIVEHCHVDNAKDSVFCDSRDELIAFGEADARAVAKYFGLKSTALDLDYSKEMTELPAVTPGELVGRAVQDTTDPTLCEISLKEAIYDQDLVTVEVKAEDPDSNLIYYAYSLDGGKTFCDNLIWPEGDVLTGEYKGLTDITLEIPDGTVPQICFKVTNPYDLSKTSNVLTFERAFQKPVATAKPSPQEFHDATADLLPEKEAETDPFDKITEILLIAIPVVTILFVIALFLYLFHARREKSRKRKTSKKGRKS